MRKSQSCGATRIRRRSRPLRVCARESVARVEIGFVRFELLAKRSSTGTRASRGPVRPKEYETLRGLLKTARSRGNPRASRHRLISLPSSFFHLLLVTPRLSLASFVFSRFSSTSPSFGHRRRRRRGSADLDYVSPCCETYRISDIAPSRLSSTKSSELPVLIEISSHREAP